MFFAISYFMGLSVTVLAVFHAVRDYKKVLDEVLPGRPKHRNFETAAAPWLLTGIVQLSFGLCLFGITQLYALRTDQQVSESLMLFAGLFLVSGTVLVTASAVYRAMVTVYCELQLRLAGLFGEQDLDVLTTSS